MVMQSTDLPSQPASRQAVSELTGRHLASIQAARRYRVLLFSHKGGSVSVHISRTARAPPHNRHDSPDGRVGERAAERASEPEASRTPTLEDAVTRP